MRKGSSGLPIDWNGRAEVSIYGNGMPVRIGCTIGAEESTMSIDGGMRDIDIWVSGLDGFRSWVLEAGDLTGGDADLFFPRLFSPLMIFKASPFEITSPVST